MNMKKKYIAVFLSAACIASAIPCTAVLADGQRVVTLGADLSEEQKQAVLRYFGIEGQNILTLTINNQDERDHLGAYVPLEQIGTHTYSCAYVNPTTSGGIQVKTANLSWVTSNMIATTLSTSGVVNCEVLAAAPFEVSGTGALTGILMAYESASGASLDETKKELATQELITTTNVANSIGQQEATNIVNESKIQVIQGNVIDENDIEVIVDQVAEEQNIALSEEDRQLIADLMEQIAQQDYDYEEMKETLERVESNVQELSADSQTQNTEIEGAEVIDTTPEDPDTSTDVIVDIVDTDETETPETLAEDSILMNTDDSALGDAVLIDATNQEAVAEETQPETAADMETVQEEPDTGSDVSGLEEIPVISEDIVFEEETEQVFQTEAAVPDENTELSEETAEEDETEVAEEVLQTEEVPDQTVIPDAQVIDTSGELISQSDLYFSPFTSDSNGYEVQPAGMNQLTISFQRTDLMAGSGTLTVFHAADSSTYDTILMNDASRVAIEPLSESELTELGWTQGGKAVITLNQPLEPDTTYFIVLSEDALTSEDGASHSEATQDNLSWMIQTAANGFTLTGEDVSWSAGMMVNGCMILDAADQITYAVIEGVDTSIAEFSQYEFTESADFTVSLHQSGSTTFQVTYYNAEGTVMNSFSCTLSVK